MGQQVQSVNKIIKLLRPQAGLQAYTRYGLGFGGFGLEFEKFCKNITFIVVAFLRRNENMIQLKYFFSSKGAEAQSFTLIKF